MENAETLNAGEGQPENTQPAEDKKSFGDYAGDMGTTIKTATGKLMSVTGGIGMHSVLTVLAVIIGIYVLDFVGLGLLAGSALALAGFLTLAYVGNGLQGGTWNPLEFAAKTFA